MRRANRVVAQLKPHLSHAEQLDRLIARGLLIGNETEAVRILKRFGYYRLSGYFYALRKTKPWGQAGRLDDFASGASLDLVVALAEFDKALRVHVMHAVETIEVAMRVAIAYTLGPLGPDAHLQPEFFDGRFTQPKPGQDRSAHQDWVERYRKLCTQSRDDFVKHHREKYGGQMPVWVGVELWDFGLLSRLFEGMRVRDQAKIAAPYGALDGRIVSSWLRNFSFVRNVVAHHGRLWNRTNTAIVVLPTAGRVLVLDHLRGDTATKGKLYESLACMQYLLRTIQPASQWHKFLLAELRNFPRTELLSLESAGFPPRWDENPLWS